MNELKTSAMALRRQLHQVVDEHLDLGRPDAVVVGVDQRGVERELAELGQDQIAIRCLSKSPTSPRTFCRSRWRWVS